MRFEPQTHLLSPDRLTSEIALTNGDVIACIVEAIDETTVTARFPAGEIARIPREHFKAMRDFRPENRIYTGFREGDHWFANHSDSQMFQLRDGTLKMSGDILLAREFALPDRFRVQFDIRFLQDASFVVGIGSDRIENALDRPQNRSINEEMLKAAAKQQPDNLIEFTLTGNAGRVTGSGTSRVAGLLGMMFRANVFGVRSNRDTSTAVIDNTPLRVELLVDRPAREYVLLGNGREMYRSARPHPARRTMCPPGTRGAPRQRPPIPANAEGMRSVEIYNFGIESWPGLLADDHRDRLLTRRLGASPKAVTHALRAVNGDSLRGHLLSMRDDSISFQSRLDTLTIPRSSVVEVISLQPLDDMPPPSADGDDLLPAQIKFRRGGAVTLYDLRTSDEFLLGRSELAGDISVPWTAVAMIDFGTPTRSDPPFADWVVRDPPPIPTSEPSQASPVAAWLGKPAPDFQISFLDGPMVSLSDLRGRPVMLDFWATWCGPCLASMPTLMQVAETYEGKVEFIAVNQQEEPRDVREFVNSRLWDSARRTRSRR